MAPDSERISAKLHDDIKSVCETMIRVHYFEEANWLWMAAASPALCASHAARRALQNARTVAAQFGFPSVARWVEANILAEARD
jgi:hypothetical protein